MKLIAIPIAAALMALIGASGAMASVEDRTLPYGCNDLVVVGRIAKSGTYEPVEEETDFIGHGWVSARIKVKMILKGKGIPAVLPVRYLAHARLHEDRDFLIVIYRAEQGYEIKTAQLMSARPLLATHCD